MKKMFYVLLALLVSMVLVFGVSCDNSMYLVEKLILNQKNLEMRNLVILELML